MFVDFHYAGTFPLDPTYLVRRYRRASSITVPPEYGRDNWIVADATGSGSSTDAVAFDGKALYFIVVSGVSPFLSPAGSDGADEATLKAHDLPLVPWIRSEAWDWNRDDGDLLSFLST